MNADSIRQTLDSQMLYRKGRMDDREERLL